MVRARFKSRGVMKLLLVARTVDEVWPLLEPGLCAGSVDALWR